MRTGSNIQDTDNVDHWILMNMLFFLHAEIIQKLAKNK